MGRSRTGNRRLSRRCCPRAPQVGSLTAEIFFLPARRGGAPDPDPIRELASLAIIYRSEGWRTAGGIRAEFAAETQVKFVNARLTRNGWCAACVADLILWRLPLGTKHSLELSSERFYATSVELPWPPAGPGKGEMQRISMVERIGPGCLRAVLTWDIEGADVDFHAMNVQLPFAVDGDGWGDVARSNHVYFRNKGPCWGGVELDADARGGFGAETLTFDSSTEAGTYRLAVHRYSGKDDAPFGDEISVAVELYDHLGLVAREHPDPSVFGDAQAWYVGDVVKDAAGFSFERKSFPLGPQVISPRLMFRSRAKHVYRDSVGIVFTACAGKSRIPSDAPCLSVCRFCQVNVIVLDFTHAHIKPGSYLDPENSGRIRDLSAIECSVDEVSGLSEARRLELVNGSVNRERSKWRACLFLWLLQTGQQLSLVFSSPAFYESRIVLSGPLPGADSAVHVAMVPRIEEGSMHVVLAWGAEPKDVDLHVMNVAVPATVTENGWLGVCDGNHVFFHHPAESWGGVSLEADVRTGFGPERVVFRRTTLPGRYRLAVHVFNEKAFGSGAADVVVELFDHAGVMARVRPDSAFVANAQAWYVGDVVKSEAGFAFEESGQPPLHSSKVSSGQICFILMLDVSGSMEQHWGSLRAAFNAFIEALKSKGGPEQDPRVTVVVFDNRAWTAIDDRRLSELSPQSLTESMPGGGGTSYRAAFSQCHLEIARFAQEQRRYVTIFMTDGEGDDCSGEVDSMLAKVGGLIIGYKSMAFGVGASGRMGSALEGIEQRFRDFHIPASTVMPQTAQELRDAFALASSQATAYTKS